MAIKHLREIGAGDGGHEGAVLGQVWAKKGPFPGREVHKSKEREGVQQGTYVERKRILYVERKRILPAHRVRNCTTITPRAQVSGL
ncbi:MAG: hypothetical protein ABIN58_04175 [candidate division WOR-3 bacterium]